jgi:hypothetical protein
MFIGVWAGFYCLKFKKIWVFIFFKCSNKFFLHKNLKFLTFHFTKSALKVISNSQITFLSHFSIQYNCKHIKSIRRPTAKFITSEKSSLPSLPPRNTFILFISHATLPQYQMTVISFKLTKKNNFLHVNCRSTITRLIFFWR